MAKIMIVAVLLTVCAALPSLACIPGVPPWHSGYTGAGSGHHAQAPNTHAARRH